MKSAAKEQKVKKEFLDKFIFQGLTNLNTGFDAESIKYFNSHDFEIVLDRVEDFGLGIYGIEPWKNGEYYSVKLCEDYCTDPSDPAWYRTAFNEFLNSGDELQYAATYYIPEKLNDNE